MPSSLLLLLVCFQAPAAESPARPPESRFQWNLEERMRLESYDGWRFSSTADRWLLNRIRLNLSWQAASWLKFSAQGQDARLIFKLQDTGRQPFMNQMDLRLAFADLQLPGGHTTLRAGRQEFIYGEERVLGAANWGNTGRAFDAVKLVWKSSRWQWDLAAASPVLPLNHGLSHHRQGNNLYFAYGQWKGPWAGASLEPYWMYRTGGFGEALRGIDSQHRWVSGLRLAGTSPGHWRYSFEAIRQGGTARMAGLSGVISATAAHARLGFRFPRPKWRPELLAEYNYASGDRTPGDGRHSTFDQLFPTSHDKYGLADQVGWQNIHHWAGGVELHPASAWILRCLAHGWRLAQSRDGLYAASGAMLFRDPSGASGLDVGREVDLVAQYTRGHGFIGFGYGHLFPGAFLQHTTPGVSLHYVFLNSGYRFH
jgi:hypothetical protein